MNFYWKHAGPAYSIYITMLLVNILINQGKAVFWLFTVLITMSYFMFLALVREWWKQEGSH